MRGRQYDAQRLGGVAVKLEAHLPIERQVRVIGATWLDQQLIGGGMKFSLVPWKSIIEQGLGQQIAATVRGGGVSWDISLSKGRSIG